MTATGTQSAPAARAGSLLRAVLLENVHSSADPILEAAGFEVRRATGSLSGADLAAELRGAALLGIRSKTRVPAEALAGAPSLLAIGCFCIGTDQVDLAAAGRAGIPVFNAPFSNTRSVAEMTLAEVVALARRLFEKSAGLHAGRWDKSARDAHEVRGRTLGIVGYGHIGSQLSVLAESLGMRVIFHDVARKLPLGNAHSVPTLDALLAEADVVSLHVPATPQTRHLIGRAQLERMKPGAHLVNNARGSVVDLEALAEALREGRIGGAAVDVFPAEPEGNGDGFQTPLRGLPNVILTPHIGGSTEEAQESIAVEVAEKLVRFHAHGTTQSAVSVPEVDLPLLRPDQLRITHFHHNVPGVLGRLHTMLADLGVNINAEYLQSNRETSYVILDVERTPAEAEVKRRLATVPETIRVRTLG